MAASLSNKNRLHPPLVGYSRSTVSKKQAMHAAPPA
jgi:hypothetical protein